MRASIMGYCDMCFEFASPIAAFWLVGACEKHKERLGKFDGRIVRKARRLDRSESSLGRLSGRLAESIVWVVCRADIRKARQVDCWGELPRGIAGSQGSFGRKRRQGASLRGSDSGCFRVIHNE